MLEFADPPATVLDQLEAYADRLLSEPVPCEGAVLGAQLKHARRVIDKLELAFSSRVDAFVASDQWDVEGFQTPTSWLRQECKVSYRDALTAMHVGAERA